MHFRSEKRLNFRGRASDDDSTASSPTTYIPEVGVKTSETSPRVPTHRHSHGENVDSLFVSYGYGRNILPSKWEDAEKWILSPVSVDGHGNVGAKNPTFPPYRRRPKSRSGPLGSPARIKLNAVSKSSSPLISNSVENSPLITGIFMADCGSCGAIGEDGTRSRSESQPDHCLVQEASANV